jgi:hypothetical protein
MFLQHADLVRIETVEAAHDTSALNKQGSGHGVRSDGCLEQV